MSSPFDGAAEAELFDVVDLLEKNAKSLGVGPAAVQRLRSALQRGTQALRDQARAFNSAQHRLLAHVSHELRTPLTPALLSVCLLQRDQSLSEDARDILATIQRHIEQEAKLIDSLIDQAAFIPVDTKSPPRLRIA